MVFYVLVFIILFSLVLYLFQYKSKKAVSFGQIVFLLVLTIVTLFLLFRGQAVLAGISAFLIAIAAFGNNLLNIMGIFKTINQLRGGQAKEQKAAKGMAEEEAREILDVSKDATDAEIKLAYQRLMKKNHPDHGGSAYIAKQLNEAKKILLKANENKK